MTYTKLKKNKKKKTSISLSRLEQILANLWKLIIYYKLGWHKIIVNLVRILQEVNTLIGLDGYVDLVSIIWIP